jgi:hypothetical protein
LAERFCFLPVMLRRRRGRDCSKLLTNEKIKEPVTNILRPQDVGAAVSRDGGAVDRDRPSRLQAEEAVRTLICWAGDDPTREGLLDTPERVARAYEEWFAGYDEDPTQLPPVTTRSCCCATSVSSRTASTIWRQSSGVAILPTYRTAAWSVFRSSRVWSRCSPNGCNNIGERGVSIEKK